MENNKNKVSVIVAGQRFNIITDKTEKYVIDIASRIDARISSLVMSQNMTRERAAVLTALDFADDSELDKENIAAVKEQIKDYLHEIERLQDDNAKLSGDYNLLKAEYERLIEERRSAEDAQHALAECQEKLHKAEEKAAALDRAEKELKADREKLAALSKENEELKKSFDAIKRLTAEAASEEEEDIPLPEEPPVKEEKPITAEDDLFFDMEEEEEAPRPEKKKKNRHEHSHVNPYQQKAKNKEQKGYTQQRQFSFFDIDE